MRLPHTDFQKVLIFGLVLGCVLHPASSAAGLLIIFAAQIAERYFTRNISDPDRQAIAKLKADVDKVGKLQAEQNLAKAFGGRP